MLTGRVHKKFVYDRRMDLLSSYFANIIKPGSKILDVGCGDGKIDSMIMEKADVNIEGIDILVRGETYVPVKKFDGRVIPYSDNSFDTVIIIDVLHHTDDPKELLGEIKRVAKRNIIIKDHTANGFMARSILQFMDYVGNAHYGVRLPYNYMREKEWEKIFQELSLNAGKWEKILHLYPMPWGLIFDRKLHFIVDLQK